MPDGHSRAAPIDLASEIELPLDLSITERVEFFKERVIRHSTFADVRQELLEILTGTATADMVLVIGPTGVGKSTLRQSVLRDLLEAEFPAMEEDPGYVPFAEISAVMPTRGNFRWNDYFYRCLDFYREPYQNYKRNYPRIDQIPWKPVTGSAKDLGALQRTFENCIAQRRTKVIFIDEAQALLRYSGGRGLLDQMDVLKTLSNNTGIKHVLLGTYDLLNATGLSAQLDRRSEILHFPRYMADDKKEQSKFRDLLYSLQCFLPVPNQPDFRQELKYFYERTAGCGGILKDWLTRALEISLKKGKDTIPMEIIQKTTLSNFQLKTIIEEMVEGESMLAGPPDSALSALLKPRKPAANPAMFPASTKDSSKKGTRHPGMRKPKRDPVGVPKNVT